MSQLAHTRPRSITEIVDASFRLYRARFSDLLVVSALLFAPLAVLRGIATETLQQPLFIAGNLMYLVAEGAIAIVVAASIERGETTSAGDAFRALGGRWGNVIGAALASGLLVLIGLILLIIPGFIFFAWTMVAVPVAAIEGLSIGAAISRSRALARGRIGHVLGTMLLVWLIVFALIFGAALMLGLLFAMIGVPERIIDMIGELLMIPCFPLIGVTVTLLYYDLSVRSEGADVAAMIDALPATPPEPA